MFASHVNLFRIHVSLSGRFEYLNDKALSKSVQCFMKFENYRTPCMSDIDQIFNPTRAISSE